MKLSFRTLVPAAGCTVVSRRLARFAAGGLILLAAVLLGMPPARAATHTVRDNFGAVLYSNNNGSTSWTGNWTEMGDDSSPSTGGIIVISSVPGTNDLNTLRLQGPTSGTALTTRSIRRTVNLTGATAAFWSFSFGTRGTFDATAGEDRLRFRISSDGGITFTTLETIEGTSLNNRAETRLFDILGHASANTVIEYEIRANATDEQVFVDNVQVLWITPDAPLAVTPGVYQGVVFQDYNANGFRDAAPARPAAGYGETRLAIDRGVPGVTVSLYDSANVLRGSAVTGPNGAFSVTPTGVGPYRLEYTTLPPGYRPGPVGTHNASTVRFVPAGGASGLDLGINVPREFALDNPNMLAICYVFGDQVNGQWRNEPVLVNFPYNAGSDRTTPNIIPPQSGQPAVPAANRTIINNEFSNPTSHSTMVLANKIGTTYGLAYSRLRGRAYAAAFFKRHAGFGAGADNTKWTSDDPGAIYVVDPVANTVTGVFTVPGVTVNAHDFAGHIPGPTPPDYDESYIRDGGNVAWQGVGTTSLGGMDINEAETRLYVMDLQNRRLVMLDAVTGAFLGAANVPTPPGIAPADVRPFGVKVHRGVGYITITGSAETTATVDTFTDVDNDGLYKGPETFWDENQNGVFDGTGTPPGEELFDRNGNGLRDLGEPFVDNDGNGIYNEGDASKLKGFVYTFDLNTLAFGSSPLYTIDFRYERIYGRDHLGATGHWRPWRDTFRAIPREQFDTTFEWSRYPIYPQPWLKAIEFDNNGDLIIAIADRYGHQIGSDAPDNPDLPFKLYNAATVGDLLKAGWNGTTWVLESGARVSNVLDGVQGVGPTTNKMGPGGGEFYYNDHYSVWHPETTMGAIIQVPGYPEVMTAIFDPNWLFRNGAEGTAFDGGFAWFDNATGRRTRNYRLYDGSASYPTFGKASGLGGIVIQTRAAYLELGNRLWSDTNKNGIQDPGEPVFSGVSVSLFRPGFGPDGIAGNADDNNPISTVTTDANGNYLFSNDDRKTDTASADYGMNLLYNTDYVIGIRDSNFTGVLSGFIPTTANAAGVSNDAVLDVYDSDAVIVNAGTGASFSTYGVALNTGTQGYNNHSYDFGFVGPVVGVGNLVFKDSNANGRFDVGDLRVPGARVELWTAGPNGIPADGDDVFVAATTTDGNGRYLFQTNPGTYYVKIPASEFQAGKPLDGFVSSTGHGGDDGKDDSGSTVGAPGDENGIDDLSPATNGIRSVLITLSTGGEPVNGTVAFPNSESGDDANRDNTFPGSPDSSYDLTIDFGFVAPGVGNLVWLDNGAGGGIAGNGIRDGAEAGIPGVTVQLWRDNGDGLFNTGTDTLVGSSTTDAAGHYYIPAPNGNYFVHIPATSFAGPLAGLVSSPGHGGDTGKDDSGSLVGAAGDENGVDSANPGVTGITSVLINLAAGAEPVNGTGAFPNSESGTDNAFDDARGDSSNDLTVDFAFVSPSALLGIGNLVFLDYDGNSHFSAGDGRAANVRVELWANGADGLPGTGDDILVSVMFTDANGRYFFNAIAGQYNVRIPASEFQAGGPLFGYLSSPGAGGDTGKDDSGSTVGAPGDENGLDDPNPAVNGIRSGTITLAAGAEPVDGVVAFPNSESGDNASSDNTRDSNVDLTVDFGFVGVGVGNLVWLDNGAGGGIAGNGIRDGTEAGVPGVAVSLWRDNGDGVFNTGSDTLVTTQTTDANGRYLFFTAPGNYFVALPPGNFSGGGALVGLVSSPGHGGDTGKDDSGSTVGAAGDENGVDMPNLPVTGTSSGLITLAAGAEPVNGNVAFPQSESGTANTSDDGYGDDRVDLTVDFAFVSPTVLVGVGNLVFRDNNASGRFDAGDDRISNVLVQLFRDNGDNVFDSSTDTLVASQFTDASGRYLFNALPGNYFVHAALNNFLLGGPLHNHVSTPGNGGDNGKDDSGATVGVAGDENGVDNPFPTVNGITSVLIALAAGSEPVDGTLAAPNSESGDNAASDNGFGDNRYDLTVDFGFIPSNLLVGVGNLVFLDNNADGQYGAGDAPRANVLVELWRNPNGTIGDGDDVLVASQFTDAVGVYLFHTTPGQYYVKVPATQFQLGGPLYGYWSSPGVGSDNQRDQSAGSGFSGDENGIDNASPETNGITTHNFTLAAGTEPVDGGGATNERVYLPAIDNPFGDSNYDMTIDLGFFPASGLGNLVFLDNNANGKFDTGDTRIPNVLLELRVDDGDGFFNPALDGVLRTTVTDSNGRYRFLAPPGNYFVHIPASQFTGSGPLVGRFSSLGFGGDNGTDDNQDENGVDQPLPAVTGITSVLITLNPGSEPVDAGTEKGDDAAADNLWSALTADNRFDWTIDFGFVTTAPAYVSLGSTVFQDDNANGLHDGGEPGISGVVLQLLRPGVGPDGIPGTGDDALPVATATTDSSGNYHFTNLLPGQYQVVIPAANFTGSGALVTRPLSSPITSTSDDNIDGDDNGSQTAPFLQVVGPLITLSVGGEPLGNGVTGVENKQAGGQDDSSPFVDANGDMTVDFGFVPSSKILGVGNLVFLDNNANGYFDAGDTRAANVTVELYQDVNNNGIPEPGGADGAPVQTTLTDAQGRYLFLVFTPDDYFVHIPAAEFNAGGDLVGYVSTPGAGDPNDGTDDSGAGSPVDGDENGIDAASPATTGVSSGVFNLAYNQEPVDPPGTETGDNRSSDNVFADANLDLTLDLGFTLPTSLVGVGNLVYRDNNLNGVFDAGDTRMANVEVQLWRDDGDGIFNPISDTFVASVFTDANGRYLHYASPGDYFVYIPPTQFQAGGPLEGLVSVPGHGGDTGVDDQADENGVDDPNPASNGIVTVRITLAAGAEPVDAPGTELGDAAASDNALGDNRYDLTVDFGFRRPVDLGDLPDTAAGTGSGNYQTLLSDNGPWHVATGPLLGQFRDTENDGQPTAGADGDDLNGVPDDEDGVVFPALTPGAAATIVITSSGAGVLNAFMDWNGDGDFADPGESYTLSVSAGINNLNLVVPPTALTGTPLGARFRLSTGGGLGPTGGAADGEVEDYLVTVAVGYDLGDLPDTGAGTGSGNYQTLLADNGPRHVVGALRLGAAIDSETDGQPTAGADGDDLNGATPDDEDGVVFPALTAGAAATIVITSSGAGVVNAFMDWNGDGDFADPGESYTLSVSAGINNLNLVVPPTALTGTPLGARFRLSSAGGLSPTGDALDGEVEDYLVTVAVGYDLGDLPDTGPGTGSGNYQTLLADNGPRHVVGALRLGAAIDSETDGQPTAGADGDDLNGATPDDEDGVTIPALTLLATVNITINSSGTGVVNAFIDWNNNGVLNDPGESYTLPVSAGANSLTITVPLTAATGTPLGARFRLSSAGGLSPTGDAPDGEVEDYLVTVATIPTAAQVLDFAARPAGGATVLTWRTGYESGTLGFRILKQEGPDGPWEPVSAELVPAQRGLAGSEYEVRLSGVTAGDATRFRLEELEEDGSVRQHGPFGVTAAGPATLAESIRRVAGRLGVNRPAPDRLDRGGPVAVSASPTPPVNLPAMHLAPAPAPVRPVAPNRAPYAIGRTAAAGVHYVSAAALAAATGREAAEFERLIREGGIGVSHLGATVPHLPAADGAGLYFYAPAAESLYTAQRSFWFSGLRSLIMQQVDGGSPAAPGTAAHRFVQRLEQNNEMVATLTENPEVDTWMWNNFLSKAGGGIVRSYGFLVQNLSAGSGSGQAAVKVRLHGADAGARTVRAQVFRAGTLVATLGEVTWAGKAPAVLEGSFAASLLANGGHQLRLVADVPAGAEPNSMVYMDWFEVDYPAQAVAKDGAAAVNPETAGVHSATGFSTAQILVLDITDPLLPHRVANPAVTADGTKFRVAFNAQAGRKYVAVETAAAKPPASLSHAATPTLGLARNRAEYLVLAHPSLAAAAEPLAAHRRSQGLTAAVVSLAQVANEFGQGDATPAAIEAFLRTAKQRWAVPPKHLLLVGAGSWDYRNLLGKGDNLVPPRLAHTRFGLYASDSVYGDVDGDGVREVAVGRLPATTPQQVADFVAKVLAHEAALNPADRRALLVADLPDAGGNFPGDSEALRALLEPAFAAQTAHADVLGTAGVRSAVLTALGGPLDLLAYSGHGGHGQFGPPGYLKSEDVATLGNAGQRLPIVTAMTCVSGNFAVPGHPAIAQHLVLAPGRGAAAVWAPTGLSMNDHAQFLNRAFARRLAEAPSGTRLGALIKAAVADYHARFGKTEFLDIYNLLGDPATLVHP